MAQERSSRLWVCWDWPPELPKESDLVLSFLSPSKEEGLRNHHAGEIMSAREASLSVRSEARATYLRIVARIGAVRLAGGSTLRQALSDENATNAWWYHPVSFKDCESDPTFDRIIAI